MSDLKTQQRYAAQLEKLAAINTPAPESVVYTTKTIQTDGARVSLTTDDRGSGHTLAVLRIEVHGSDCISVAHEGNPNPEDDSAFLEETTELVVRFRYGTEGQSILDALTRLFA